MKKFAGLVLALVAASGCGITPSRQAFTCPEKGGAPWTEVQSRHFVLQTDFDPEAARKVSSELEAMFSALSDLGFTSAEGPKTRMDVVYFRHRQEYEQVAPKMSAAIFESELHDFERTPIALIQGDFTAHTKETIQHELTHLFVHAHYPQAPIWLDEGLASYFQTLDTDTERGAAVIGRPRKGTRFIKGPWAHLVEDGEIVTLIPMTEAPRVRALLAMDVTEFEGGMTEDSATREGEKIHRKISTHYASANSLVRLLFEPAYRPLFEDYLQRLYRGTKSDDAWTQTVGTVPLEKLENDYQESLVRREVLVSRTKYVPPRAPPEGVRTLSDADVHVLWARLRNWEIPEGRAAAEAEMKEAYAHEPNHAALAALRAWFEKGQGNYAAAENVLNRALQQKPNDPKLLNALGWVKFQALARQPETSQSDALASLGPIASKLAPIAKSSAELDLLGRYSLLAGDVDAGLVYEKRAIAANTSCYECFASAALMLNDKGRVREALDAATLALGLLPDGRRSPWIAKQIDTYRRRLQESR